MSVDERPRFTEVGAWGALKSGDGVFVLMKGADGLGYPFELQRDAAMQLILALRQAVSKLPDPPGHQQETTLFEIARCAPLLTTQPGFGVVLETIEGLQFPLKLDQAVVDSLSAAIRHAAIGDTSHH